MRAPDAGWARIGRFSYFITFYSLVLGFSLTELLGGFAHMVPGRSRSSRRRRRCFLLLTIPYWDQGAIPGWIASRWGY